VGIESTVVDATRSTMRILRSGSVSAEELRDVLGDVQEPILRHQTASPGTSPRHYAPCVPCELVERDALSARLEELDVPSAVLCFDASAIASPHRAFVLASDAETCARQLYDTMRDADRAGLQRIIIEQPSGTGGLWDVIRDRLVRATSP
jgi:L-threonylcarbamoyladenylate synthase